MASAQKALASAQKAFGLALPEDQVRIDGDLNSPKPRLVAERPFGMRRGRDQCDGIWCQLHACGLASCRNEYGITPYEIDPGVFGLDMSRTLGDGHNRKIIRGKLGWLGAPRFHQSEFIACDEQTLFGGWSRRAGRKIDRTTFKVDDLEGLLDVQRPRLAVFIDAIPVIEPKCAIARLLDFCHHQAGAEGVDSARWDENAIADLGAKNMQAFFRFSRRDCHFEVRTTDSWLEPGVKNRVRIGLNHVPRLCFSPIWLRHLRPVSVVRVDLDAQHPLAIKIF